jgi:hypothetical protein
MRKLLGTALAAALLCMSLTAGAAQSSVLIKNNDPNKEPVTCTYNAETSSYTVTSVKELMTRLDGLDDLDSVVQTLTISSQSADMKPISFYLRLSLPEKTSSGVQPEPEKPYSETEYDALDYYNIKITDEQGATVYSYEDDNAKKDGAYKDIPLGVMNNENGEENKIFNLTISVNKDAGDAKGYAKNLDWSIVSAAEKSDIENDGQDENTADNASEVTLSAGEYLCGEDIAAGRYVMTGSGKVHVYADDGALKSTIALKNKNDSKSNGIGEYIITLQNGEKLTLENDTLFTPYSQQGTQSKTETSGSAQNAAVPSPSPTPDSEKKQNIGSILVPVIEIAALAAAAGITFVIYRKRNKNDDEE